MLLRRLRTQPAMVSPWRVPCSKRVRPHASFHAAQTNFFRKCYHTFFQYRPPVSSFPFIPNVPSSVGRLPFLRRLPHRIYSSFPGGQPSSSRDPAILPYAFLTLCTSIYLLLTYYARTSAANLLPLVDAHAVCSLSNLRQGRYYTLLTSSVTHFSLTHLAFNMYGLYTLGPLICSTFGAGGLLVLWVGGVLSLRSRATGVGVLESALGASPHLCVWGKGTNAGMAPTGGAEGDKECWG